MFNIFNFNKQKKMTEKELAKLFRKRVLNGIDWLDKRFPDRNWLNKIIINVLDLKNVNVCVAGQVFGSYWNVFSDDGDINSTKHSQSEAIANGFQIEKEIVQKYSHAYDLLTYIWFKELTAISEKKFKNGFKI